MTEKRRRELSLEEIEIIRRNLSEWEEIIKDDNGYFSAARENFLDKLCLEINHM